MAFSFYLTSIEPAGKTVLAALIGQELKGRGKKTGYFVPLKVSEEEKVYQDAPFMKEMLDLDDNIDDISPIHKPAFELWKMLSESAEHFDADIKEYYEDISEGRDIVIIEGLSGLIKDGTSTLACYRISETLDIPVVVILRYSDDISPSILDRVKKELGDKLAGVVINFIPATKMDMVKKEATKKFNAAGIKVLGMVKEDRTLLGISVGDLAKKLGGEIVTAGDNVDGIVENIMLGALPIDSAAAYYGRKANKAAIIRSERYDSQLAALETSTACLILTGNAELQSMVTNFAEEKKIPIIVVQKETTEVIDDLEVALSNSVFHNPNKMKKVHEVLVNWDFNAFYTAIGLAV